MNRPALRLSRDDPCERTDPHLPHRNWQSENCGVCPGRKRPANPPKRDRGQTVCAHCSTWAGSSTDRIQP